jgi:Protein of unknown function (DUF2637)
MAADQVIRWTTAGAVVGVAAVAAVASCEHAYALVRAHGEAGWTGRLVPLTVDGLIYASSMAMLDCARRKLPVPALARWLLGRGIAATLAANVAHGLGIAVSVACDGRPGDGPLRAQAAEAFADEVAARRVPSARAIRARLHIGQPRAQRVRAYLATLTST